MKNELSSYSVKPIVMCCSTIILGRNVENRVVGIDINYDSKKDKYYAICPKCGFYQFIDRNDIKDLL